jgi:hypothetical protein
MESVLLLVPVVRINNLVSTAERAPTENPSLAQVEPTIRKALHRCLENVVNLLKKRKKCMVSDILSA